MDYMSLSEFRVGTPVQIVTTRILIFLMYFADTCW